MIGPPGWRNEPFTPAGGSTRDRLGFAMTPRLHHSALSLGPAVQPDLFAGVEHKETVLRLTWLMVYGAGFIDDSNFVACSDI